MEKAKTYRIMYLVFLIPAILVTSGVLLVVYMMINDYYVVSILSEILGDIIVLIMIWPFVLGIFIILPLVLWIKFFYFYKKYKSLAQFSENINPSE